MSPMRALAVSQSSTRSCTDGINGETAPGGWDLGTATDIIEMVIGRLTAARGGER